MVFRGFPEDLSSSCSTQHRCSPSQMGKLCRWLGLLSNRSEIRTSSQGCSRNSEGTGHGLRPWGSPSKPKQEQMWRQAVGSWREEPSSQSEEENVATWVSTMFQGLPTALQSQQPPTLMTERRMLRHNAVEAWTTMLKTGCRLCSPPVRSR